MEHQSDASPVYHDGVADETLWVSGTMALAGVPRVFALYQAEDVEDREPDGIAGWVVGMADGTATIIDPSTGKAYTHGTLQNVAQWWAPMRCADLVAVVPATPAGTTV